MKKSCLTLANCLILLFLSHSAMAEIYKNVDANGHVTYSNLPSKGSTKLDIEPPAASTGSEIRGSKAKTPTPANFPRVDRQTQNQRDDKRKSILQEELSTEKKSLEDAKKTLAANNADGKTAASDEKSQKLQADVDTHEKNIQLLQKELDALK